MSNTEVTIAVVLTAISMAVSAIFIIYGWSIASSEQVPALALLFAAASIGYGMTAFALLLWSWAGCGMKATRFIKLSASVYLLIFVAVSLDLGIISGQELLGIVGVAIAGLVHWISVRHVAHWRRHA